MRENIFTLPRTQSSSPSSPEKTGAGVSSTKLLSEPTLAQNYISAKILKSALGDVTRLYRQRTTLFASQDTVRTSLPLEEPRLAIEENSDENIYDLSVLISCLWSHANQRMAVNTLHTTSLLFCAFTIGENGLSGADRQNFYHCLRAANFSRTLDEALHTANDQPFLQKPDAWAYSRPGNTAGLPIG